jgi:hypothetical protein
VFYRVSAGGHAANPAAERVLDELLQGCCCREERATLLPEACMSPGLEVSSSSDLLLNMWAV